MNTSDAKAFLNLIVAEQQRRFSLLLKDDETGFAWTIAKQRPYAETDDWFRPPRSLQ